MMTTMMTATMLGVLLFAAAAAASGIAFVIASLPPKLNCALVYASTRRMGSAHPDADMTHAFLMRLYCVKRANKHYMHTYIKSNENQINQKCFVLVSLFKFLFFNILAAFLILTEHFDVFQDEHVNCTDC